MSCYYWSATRVLTITHALRADSDGAQPGPDRSPAIRLPSKKRRQKPSLMEIERAIGAGRFKDRNPIEKEEKKTMFDSLLLNTLREDDSEVQKKLRETGEWITERTENASRSSGQQILKLLFAMIIPLGILLLVAAGVIPLPFSSPYLDDLLS